eukprot:272724-Prymnesium_polylepis.1
MARDVGNGVCDRSCNHLSCSHDDGDCPVDSIWEQREGSLPSSLAGAGDNAAVDARVSLHFPRALNIIIDEVSGITYARLLDVMVRVQWHDARLLDTSRPGARYLVLNPLIAVMPTELSGLGPVR